MDKRLIKASLAAISIALIGLVVIQVIWIRMSIDQKEAQFSQSVDNALFAVSERLERIERMQELKRHRAGRRMLMRLDSLREEAGTPIVAEEAGSVELDMERAEYPEGALIGSGPGLEAPPARPAPEEPDPMEAVGPPSSQVIDPDEYEALVTDMVRGILATELTKDIRTRIDIRSLDSLLALELGQAGLGGDLRYGIFSSTGKWVPLHGDHVGNQEDLAKAPFRERLFRHDVAGPSYYLHLSVSHSKASLFSGTWPMLIASVVFIGLIAWAFASTIRTIVRQRRLNDIRTDLVNNLTHELKTPISTIGLACEALSDPSIPKTDQQVRTYTAMIRDEARRLGALVENVLQSAVQDSGRMVLKPVELDLHAVIQDVVRSSSIQLARRNGRIDLELKAELHALKGDRIHVTNLLYNLIDNAVKYTEKEPRIRVATSSDDEGVTVHITDNGIGIPASEQRKIFDRLYRVPTGNLHNAKGFGLGLSYVKSVVDRHAGRIKVESTPGQGSTFHIFLPFEHVQTNQTARR